MQLRWHLDGWINYVNWQTNDKKTLRKINTLIEDTLRHPKEGLGKPEPLKDIYPAFGVGASPQNAAWSTLSMTIQSRSFSATDTTNNVIVSVPHPQTPIPSSLIARPPV